MNAPVAVIGAGAAGLAAALDLAERGLRVVLLEARDEPGGRCRTRTVRGLPYDLGASWIHGASAGNPHADLALALGEPVCADPRRRFGVRAGRLDAAVGEALGAAFERALARFAAACSAAADLSLAQVLTGEDLTARITRTLFADWIAGLAAHEVDVRDWMATPAGEDWVPRRGYGTLLARLARRVLDHARIAFHPGCAVTAVEVRPRRLHLVTARGGLDVPFAVLTVPLPLLLEGPPAIRPGLPEPWQRAGEGLAMGRAVKVFLALEGDPFGVGESWFAYPSRADQLDVLFWLRPCGLDLAYGFWGGPALAELDAETLKEATRARFADLFGHEAARRIRALEVHPWHCDPWARGAYTCARPGRHRDRRLLEIPAFDRLFYAGEANAPGGWHATVAGAWLAGRRAAFEIATRIRGRRPGL